MRCVKCGRELPESAVFCSYCGERIAGGDQDADKPIYLTEVKGVLKSGKLAVYRDRVEFCTSSVQKTVFDYSSLVSVKKRLLPTPAILFITEDGRTEVCAATSKNIHEAFLYIEQAAGYYIEARKEHLLAQGVKYSLVSSMGMVNSGVLNLSDDRAEFQSKSGKQEIVSFQDVKSVDISAAGALEFLLFDGERKAFGLEKELRDQVLAFVKNAVEPYLEQRREALLERGIYYSFLSKQGQESGILNIFEDKMEFTAKSGRTDTVVFREVRTASLYPEMLELHLVDGRTKAFAVDRDEQNDILAFVRKAIEPYVKKRTEGFETAFGLVERIEMNQERRVFHIIRQNGNVITEECPLENIVKCQQEESSQLHAMISGIRRGGKAIVDKASGRQEAANEEEMIRSIDMLLTIQTGEEQRTETVRFGDFPLGISRTNPKYAQYAADATGFMDYLRENWPECQLVVPAPLPAQDPAEEEPPVESQKAGEELPAETYEASAPSGEEADPLGVRKYIRRITEYIRTYQTPKAIAFQGSKGSGDGMKLLADSLAERYEGNVIWLHSKQLCRSGLGEKLSVLIGAALVSQLGGAGDGKMVKFAKASINLAVMLFSQGNSDGQVLIETLFKDNSANPLEDMIKTFSELVNKKTSGEKERVIVLVDDLDRVIPARAVEFLEALEVFLGCENCVFLVDTDYDSMVRGVNELYGQDKGRGEAFFNRIFRITFRLPALDLNLESRVKNKLESIQLAAEDESEMELYCKLLERSVGSEPDDMDHLMDSFQLLKTLADEEMYESKRKRLILFGLVCMQMRFLKVYEQLVRIKDSITPKILLELCSEQSDVVACSGLREEEQGDFRKFARVFCDIIDADRVAGISQAECGMFAQVLEFSSITSKYMPSKA